MKSLRLLALNLLVVTCCPYAFPDESSWSIEASFYENATWKKIWILRISSTGEALVRFTQKPLKNPKKIEKSRKITDEDESSILALVERVKRFGLKDVFSEDALIDGPVFFIKVENDGIEIAMASMHTGSPDLSKEHTEFIDAWNILAKVFPSDAPIPSDYEFKD